jgi:hypothetical protein
MEYAIRIAIDLMRKISSAEPVIYQRDGAIYIASEAGFIQLPYSITSHESGHNIETPKEISLSRNVMNLTGDEVHKTPSFSPGEEEYFKAIMHGPDSRSFTLEDIANTAKNLRKLPDDSNVRMIGHWSSYHSHKGGYATDGGDVGVSDARMMNRGEYIRVLEEKEKGFIYDFDRLCQELENVIEPEMTDSWLSKKYPSLNLPSFTLITENMMVNIPRHGWLKSALGDLKIWTRSTPFYHENERGDIVSYGEINTYHESPYAIHITLNQQDISARDPNELKKKTDSMLEQTTKELEAVCSEMWRIQGIIDELNKLHNRACKKNIDWSKESRRKMGAKG